MKTRTLLSATIMLIFMVVTLSTATFAWFSVSRSATAETTEITATAGGDLQICTDNKSWSDTADITLSDYNSSVLDLSGSGDGTFYSQVTPGEDSYAVAELATGSVVEFDLYFKSSSAMSVYLSSGSSVDPLEDVNEPETRPSEYATSSASFSQDVIAGAVRVAFTEDDGDEENTTDNVNLLWEPNNDYKLSASGTKYLFSTGNDADPAEYVTGASTTTKASSLGSKFLSTSSDTTETFSAVDYNSIAYLDGSNSTKVTVRVWVEGTDREAIQAAAGGKFSISLAFEAVDTVKEDAPVAGTDYAVSSDGQTIYFAAGTEYLVSGSGTDYTLVTAEEATETISGVDFYCESVKFNASEEVLIRTSATTDKIESNSIVVTIAKNASGSAPTGLTYSDDTNIISYTGDITTLEWSDDGGDTWTPFINTNKTFPGAQSITVRIIETDTDKASASTTAFEFTANKMATPKVTTDYTWDGTTFTIVNATQTYVCAVTHSDGNEGTTTTTVEISSGSLDTSAYASATKVVVYVQAITDMANSDSVTLTVGTAVGDFAA